MIVQAREEDLAKLAPIERAAAKLFPDHVITPEERASVVPLCQLAEARQHGRLWIALTEERQPVGFIVVVREGDTAFIVEVDVLPEHQGRGLGRALIQRVVHWGREEGLPRVTLTTFSDVPWNAPFYERLGFRRIDRSQLTMELTRKLDDEKNRGLRGRVAMEPLIDSAPVRG
jgi:GNAT superfamily N-acetyltransferase